MARWGKKKKKKERKTTTTNVSRTNFVTEDEDEDGSPGRAISRVLGLRYELCQQHSRHSSYILLIIKLSTVIGAPVLHNLVITTHAMK